MPLEANQECFAPQSPKKNLKWGVDRYTKLNLSLFLILYYSISSFSFCLSSYLESFIPSTLCFLYLFLFISHSFSLSSYVYCLILSISLSSYLSPFLLLVSFLFSLFLSVSFLSIFIFLFLNFFTYLS